jgi:hypothetical protein
MKYIVAGQTAVTVAEYAELAMELDEPVSLVIQAHADALRDFIADLAADADSPADDLDITFFRTQLRYVPVPLPCRRSVRLGQGSGLAA